MVRTVRPLGLILLLATLLLAGCSDAPEEDAEPPGTPTASPSPSPSPGNTTPGPEPEEPEEERERPETLNFSYGPAAGCEGSLLGEGNCVTFQAGPDAPEVDGHWQALDERYWGLRFTTTVDSAGGDSDCYFVRANGNILGNAHNGSGPCQGRVPDNTAFLFLYSYVEPHQAMTLQFRL